MAKITNEMLKQILATIGGAKNIIQYGNCMTRLRISLHDIQLVDKNRLKQIPGVLGLLKVINNYKLY